MAQRTIRAYLILGALFTGSISFIVATYVLFLISRGLNLFEVNLVNAVFMVTLFVVEVPTGAVADTWGRKASFIAACVLLGSGMFLYYVSHSFWGFVLAEAVAAVGSTCATGAFQAWLVDTLRHHGYTGPLDQVFVREQQVKELATISGAVAGAYLGKLDLALPWFMGGVMFMATAVVAALVMREEYFERKRLTLDAGLGSMRQTIAASARYGFGHKEVRFLLLLGFALAFATQAPNMQWQPRFAAHLGDRALLGWLWVAMSLSLFLGASVAKWFLRQARNEPRHALLAAQVFAGSGILLAGAGTWFPTVIAFFLWHEVGRGVYRPLKDAYLNQNVLSSERATLLSFEAMANHVGSLLGLIVSGWVAEYGSIRAAWVLSGLLLVLSACAGLWNGRQQ
ncbi:hypothetical protein HY442_02490 [Candidatus Parcubacteria bacterium]|nr:hypothetical protein [Candidatus Parcubacteria bacterium]MBI4385724.1 hypothetical protein [Candidatus Parcubacteria bacterium]